MDQKQVGEFIARRRKELKMTQKELAQKLGVTDRAVSKWENGRCMPDLSLIQPLSCSLKVGVNDLLSGEIIPEKQYRRKSEENIISMAELKYQLNYMKSFRCGFWGFYVLALSLLIYCIVKDQESSGILAVYFLSQVPDDKKGLCISADHCIRGGRNVSEFCCFYWQNVVT